MVVALAECPEEMSILGSACGLTGRVVSQFTMPTAGQLMQITRKIEGQDRIYPLAFGLCGRNRLICPMTNRTTKACLYIEVQTISKMLNQYL